MTIKALLPSPRYSCHELFHTKYALLHGPMFHCSLNPRPHRTQPPLSVTPPTTHTSSIANSKWVMLNAAGWCHSPYGTWEMAAMPWLSWRTSPRCTEDVRLYLWIQDTDLLNRVQLYLLLCTINVLSYFQSG
jgi:hypothetical protein